MRNAFGDDCKLLKLETPRKSMAYYYDLGKMFFSTNEEDKNNGYEHPVIDLSNDARYANTAISSIESKNNGNAFISYTQTPGYASWSVGTDGISSGDAPADSYAPKSSYAMSKGKMYELNKDTRIKGFRGWITLAHSIFNEPSSESPAAIISIDGIIDGDERTTGIRADEIFPVVMPQSTIVYDLYGRKVGTLGTPLHKGVYIVGGKKIFMK